MVGLNAKNSQEILKYNSNFCLFDQLIKKNTMMNYIYTFNDKNSQLTFQINHC